jgi:hypothetical protein
LLEKFTDTPASRDQQMLLSEHDGHNSKGNMVYLEGESCLVNLVGDYRYLTTGYYSSQDLECAGKTVHPTCKEVMDAYIVPLFLEKAKLAGLPVPTYYITNDYFEPPVVVDSVNPFMTRHSVVRKAGHQERVAKSLTRNYTYAICCQVPPPEARLGEFRAVLGWSASSRYRQLAASVWEVFRIPLASVRVIISSDDSPLLSALHPLPLAKLSSRELAHLKGRCHG